MPEQKFERTGEWNSSDILFSIARVPGTERLFVGSSDFQVYEFDVSAEKPERVPLTGEAHQSYVTGLALAGDQLVSGSYDGSLIWWNLADRTSIRSQPAHERWIRKVIATADGQRIISVADDMKCHIWNATSGERIGTLEGHAALTPHNYPSMLYAVAVSPDGKLIATGDRVGDVKIWDAESFAQVGEVKAPGMYTWDPKQRRHSIGGIRSLAFSPDGTKLAVGGIGEIGNIDHLGGPSRLEVFNWQTKEEPILIEDEEKKGLIEQITWRPDGVSLFGLGGDHKGFINLYDLQKREIVTQESGNGHVHAAVADESLTTFYTAAHNRIEKWKLVEEMAATS